MRNLWLNDCCIIMIAGRDVLYDRKKACLMKGNIGNSGLGCLHEKMKIRNLPFLLNSLQSHSPPSPPAQTRLILFHQASFSQSFSVSDHSTVTLNHVVSHSNHESQLQNTGLRQQKPFSFYPVDYRGRNIPNKGPSPRSKHRSVSCSWMSCGYNGINSHAVQ